MKYLLAFLLTLTSVKSFSSETIEYWKLVPSYPDKTKREILDIGNCDSHLSMNHSNEKFKKWLKKKCEEETRLHSELVDYVESSIQNQSDMNYTMLNKMVERGEEELFNITLDSGLLKETESDNLIQNIVLGGCINNNKYKDVMSYRTNTVKTTIRFVDNLLRRGYKFDEKSKAGTYLLGEELEALINCHEVYKYLVDKSLIVPWIRDEIFSEDTGFNRMMTVHNVAYYYKKELKYDKPQNSLKFAKILLSSKKPYMSCPDYRNHRGGSEEKYYDKLFEISGYNVNKCVSTGTW